MIQWLNADRQPRLPAITTIPDSDKPSSAIAIGHQGRDKEEQDEQGSTISLDLGTWILSVRRREGVIICSMLQAPRSHALLHPCRAAMLPFVSIRRKTISPVLSDANVHNVITFLPIRISVTQTR